MSLGTDSGARGVGILAAAWTYFLLYAQYGLVRQLGELGLGPGAVDRAMGALGIGGLVGCVIAARTASPRRVVRAGFLGAAAAAFLSLGLAHPPMRVLVPLVAGLSVGALTAALAGDLPAWTGAATGRAVGLATGLAYGVCNVPLLFAGSADLQALVSGGVALVGGAAAFGHEPRPGHPAASAARPDGTPGRFAGLVVALGALVALDSTAFAVIQRTPGLLAETWGGSHLQILQGGVHFAAAVATGLWIDRGALRRIPALVWVTFAVAFGLLSTSSSLAGPLYAVGISAYSAVLVAVPTLVGRSGGRRRAAVLFALAGWIASGAGVGLAQRLDRIGPLPVGLAGLAVALGLAATTPTGGRLLRLHRESLAVAAVGVGLVLATGVSPKQRFPVSSDSWPSAATRSDAVARGRAVYVAEGCLHCHSQYPRPGSLDETVWGPSRTLDREPGPPLVGNRRQGPDLGNVGCRRGPEWQRLHLEDPRALVPASRMPSYAHLFRDGRGEDLVAYLQSLGAERTAECLELRARAVASPDLASADVRHGRRLFDLSCAGCHGADARGGGPLSARLGVEPPPLDGELRWVSARDPGERARELARIVRFGLPGTSMPGHELLPERDVADLVAWLQALPEARRASVNPGTDGTARRSSEARG